MMRMLTVSLVLFMINDCFASRVARATGEKPKEGYCISYKQGGTSRLHHYVCCNNCVGTTQSSCPSIYQSASKGQYCGECGVDQSTGNGKRTYEFSCGGCDGQRDVNKKCSSWWKNIPGFCWAYVRCFRRRCKDKQSICGNGVCDSGETTKNCPMDCCYKENPEKCNKNNICDNPCCGEPSCCAVNHNANNANNVNTSGRPLAMPKHIILGIIGILCLLCNM